MGDGAGAGGGPGASQPNWSSTPISAPFSCESAKAGTGSARYTSAMPSVPTLVAKQPLPAPATEAAEPAASSSAPGGSQPALQPLGNVTESQMQPSATGEAEAAASSMPEAFHLPNYGGGTNIPGNTAAADGLLPLGVRAQSLRRLLGHRLPPAGPRTNVARFKDLQQRTAAIQRTGSQPLPDNEFLSSRSTTTSSTSAAATITVPNIAGLTVSSSSTPRGSLASGKGRPDCLERCKSVPTPTSTRRRTEVRRQSGATHLGPAGASHHARAVPQTPGAGDPIHVLGLSLRGIKLL